MIGPHVQPLVVSSPVPEHQRAFTAEACMKQGWRRRGINKIIYYYWTDPATKKQREISTGTSDPRLAERIFGRLMGRLETNEGGDAALMLLPFAALAERYKTDILPSKAETTRKAMISRISTCLVPYFGAMRVCDITEHQVVSYKTWREGAGRTGGAIQVELSNLKSIINLANRSWTLPSGRDQRMQYRHKAETVVRYFRSEQEWQDVLEACPEWIRGRVTVARFTGLRQANIIQLEWNEVNLFRRVITLPPRKMKGGRVLSIPMNQTVFDLFQSMQVVDRYVWPKPGHLKMSSWVTKVQQTFKTACREAGRPDFRFHDLRHDFCSQLVMRGVPLTVVRDLAGHRSVKTTERYAHLAPSILADYVKVLDGNSGKPLADAGQQ